MLSGCYSTAAGRVSNWNRGRFTCNISHAFGPSNKPQTTHTDIYTAIFLIILPLIPCTRLHSKFRKGDTTQNGELSSYAVLRVVLRVAWRPITCHQSSASTWPDTFCAGLPFLRASGSPRWHRGTARRFSGSPKRPCPARRFAKLCQGGSQNNGLRWGSSVNHIVL